jgi:hypothetical protein
VSAPVRSLSLATISRSLAQARTCFPSVSPGRESATGAQPESGFGSVSLIFDLVLQFPIVCGLLQEHILI